MSEIILAFWLLFTYGLLEDKCIDVFVINFLFPLHQPDRFHVAMHLFSNRSQKMSKCSKNISNTLI